MCIWVVVDGTDRRRLRLLIFGLRAGLLFGLAAVALTGNLTLWALAALTFLYAVGGVFVDSANTAMVPQVAPRSQLAAANSRIQGAMFVLEDIIGAPLASLLVLAGAAWTFGIPDLLSVLAVVVLWMVGPEALVGVPAGLFPLYFTAMAVGALSATLTVSRMLTVVADFPLMLSGFWCLPPLVVIQVIWPGPWVMAVTMVLLGFGLTVGNVIFMTMSQKLVPGRMPGRFSGAAQTASSGLAPVGALLGGLVAEHFGIPLLYLLVAGVVAASLVYPMLAVRQRDVDELELNE